MAKALQYSDVKSGTSLFRSATDATRNRGQRLFFVNGLDGDAGDLDDANQFAITTLGAYHPDDDTLPLQGVRSSYVKPGTTRTQAVYGHSRNDNPTMYPFDLASMRFSRPRSAGILYYTTQDTAGDFTTTKVTDLNDHYYKSSGLQSPSNATEVVSAYVYHRDVPVFDIFVPAGRLSSSDIQTVMDMANDTNSDWVEMLNGVKFAPQTLKFVGASLAGVDANGTLVRPTFYQFEYCVQGFGNWNLTRIPSAYIPFGGDGVTGFVWAAHYDTHGQTSAFGDAFPCYDPSIATPSSGTGPNAVTGVGSSSASTTPFEPF